ncbi:MAG: P1 family peptidase, partial [Bacteroidales bacterium]|nr:P1 family peptidase [Bacteroidales bacterium]
MKNILPLIMLVLLQTAALSQNRMRDYGIETGIFKPGINNAITDVPGVKVGHKTLVQGDDMRTGVTAIIPHDGNLFQKKTPAAIYVGNGFGKLAGYTQVKELGNIETPVILTNTMSVPAALDALITYTLKQDGNSGIGSVNGVVGETNDGGLNNIRARYVTPEHVLEAIEAA